MQELEAFIGQDMHWIRPQRLRLAFELHAGEAVVATLNWAGRAHALGTWAGGQYRVGREGWFRPRTFIYDDSTGSGDPVATFTHRGAALNFPDGRTFLWKKPKGWTTERVWQDVAATGLVRCRPARWRVPSTVIIQPEAAHLSELPLLVLLGQFLMVLAEQDAAVANTAAIVPVISGT
jgi:hypothetical protein